MKLNCSMVNISQRKSGRVVCLVLPVNRVIVLLVLATAGGGVGGRGGTTAALQKLFMSILKIKHLKFQREFLSFLTSFLFCFVLFFTK